jgi:hypothetical protein
MTHDEFSTLWQKKHSKVFADINRVLKTHGLPGAIAGLTMKPSASVRATFPAATDCCDEPCKAPPCDADEVVRLCVCPDGNGNVRIRRCCVKRA